MGINIDKFLDSFLESEEPTKEIKKEEKLINLSFEKDVEKKLSDFEKQIKPENTPLLFLEEAFQEIKKFDETLPNKFIGIDTQAEMTLKFLGDKYSQNLFIQSQQQVSIIKQLIEDEITKSDLFKGEDNLVNSLKALDSSFHLYSKIPDMFLEEKQKLSKEIKQKELNLLKDILEFKKNKLLKLKSELNSRILNLKSKLLPGNFTQVKQEFEELQHFFQSFPKIYLSDILEEKEKIIKISILVENYLEAEYLREFDEKESVINSLIEEFLTNNIQKNFNQALLIYNQILVEFDSLPNVFFQRKISLFNKINDLYGTLSKLIIKNNVSLFVDSYNYSKILEETRDYLRHIKTSRNYSNSTLKTLLDKLLVIPKEISPEVENYKKIIQNLLSKQISNKKSDLNFNKEKNNFNSNSSDKLKKQINPTKKNLQKNLSIEINNLFKLFNQSNNKEQLKVIYKKLIFYINMLQISSEEKEKLIQKVKSSLHKKRL